MRLVVEEVGPSAPEAVALREADELETLERLGGEAEPARAEADVLVVVRESSGRAVACGGLRALENGACEIVALFVRPYARSAGVGRMLLGELERRASARGHVLIRVATAPHEPEAAALFERAGYRTVEHEGAPGATRFERALG